MIRLNTDRIARIIFDSYFTQGLEKIEDWNKISSLAGQVGKATEEDARARHGFHGTHKMCLPRKSAGAVLIVMLNFLNEAGR